MDRLIALIALLLTACATEAAPVSVEPQPEEAPVAALPEALPPPPPACRVVFSPVAEEQAETAAAAARWAAATGCEIVVGEGGIAINLVDDLGLSPRGTKVHGETHCPVRGESCKRAELIIDLVRDHKAAALPHEMGHALALTFAHIEDDAHALMSHAGGDGQICADDLTLVCTRLPCQTFAPES